MILVGNPVNRPDGRFQPGTLVGRALGALGQRGPEQQAAGREGGQDQNPVVEEVLLLMANSKSGKTSGQSVNIPSMDFLIVLWQSLRILPLDYLHFDVDNLLRYELFLIDP